KMVSLPELASLPSKAEVEAIDKASRKAAKAEAKTAAKVAAASAPAAVDAATPAIATPSIPAIGSRIAAKQSKGTGGTIALVGVGLAAAAGAVFFFAFNKNNAAESDLTYERAEPAALPTMSAKHLPAPGAGD